MRLLTTLTCAGLLTVSGGGLAGAKVSTQTYKGTATGLDGKFRYGAVTVKRRGDKVTSAEIKAISATCAGQPLLRTIVFKPASRAQKILSGSAKIKSGAMKVVFNPDKTVPEAKTTLRISFSGKNASGSFREVGLCYDAGLFRARR